MNKKILFNKNVISVVVLILSISISLILFFTNENRYSKLTFKFYYELEKKIVMEDRYVLLSGDYEEKAKTIVDELLLGPFSVFNKKLLPFDTKYNSFYIRNKTLYLDLPIKIINFYDDQNFTIEESIILLKWNLMKNINNIKSVVITFDGQLLGAGPSSRELPQVKID